MSSDIEKLINLIYMTDTMRNLRSTEFGKFLGCIEQTQDWNKFKNIQEIIDLNNTHINDAIKEILNNERFVNIIKENTGIDITILEKL